MQEIVGNCIESDKIKELIAKVKEYRRGLPKYDTVEMTEEYIAVIDEIEDKLRKTVK